jgi:hypothetical protein
MHTGGIKIPVSKKKDRIVPPRVGHTLKRVSTRTSHSILHSFLSFVLVSKTQACRDRQLEIPLPSPFAPSQLKPRCCEDANKFSLKKSCHIWI